MSVGALLIGTAILLLTAIVLADPWTRRRLRHSSVDSKGVPRPADDKAVLYALRDLDFDYETGKIADSDYEPLRSKLLAEAAASLNAVDGNRQMADAQLERAVLNHHKNSGTQRSYHECGSGVEGEHRFCSHCGISLLTTCKTCGSTIQDQDTFCSGCGVPIDERIGETS
jgi:hypothetical protein